MNIHEFPQVSLPMTNMSPEAVAVLDGYWLMNTVPEAMEIAIGQFLDAKYPFTIDGSEISPLEMLEIVREILSIYNEETAK